jgi:hypothetical protein
MRKHLIAIALLFYSSAAFAADNLAVTPGAGATVRMRDTTGAGGPLSSYVILGDLTGTSILGTAGAANANVLTVQGIASGTPVPVSGTVSVGTPAVTQSGTWTVNNKGNSGNTVDFPSTQNVATPQAAWLVGGEFNTTPTAITSGNSSPLQLDTNGNLLVNVKAGGGSGGTSSSFGSAFPGTGTAVGFTDGTNMVAGRVTTYGTTPTGLNALAVNAFVTNTNANGQTTMSASSPVAIASDQTVADPCTFRKKSTANFSSSTSGGSIITASASNKTYLCAISVVASAAASVSIIEGTGSSVCTGGTTAGVWGNTGVTAANGFPFAANGGIAIGSGNASVASSGFVNQNICMLFTAGTIVATVSYVQAP